MFNNQNLKWIAVGAMIFIIIVRSYFVLAISPLSNERANLNQKIADNSAKLMKLKAELHDVRKPIEDNSDHKADDDLVSRMLKTTPEAPLVFCPVLLGEVLQKNHFEKTAVRHTSLAPIRDLPDTNAYDWTWKTTASSATQAGELMANLESRWPLAQITDFTLQSEPESGKLETQFVFRMVARK